MGHICYRFNFSYTSLINPEKGLLDCTSWIALWFGPIIFSVQLSSEKKKIKSRIESLGSFYLYDELFLCNFCFWMLEVMPSFELLAICCASVTANFHLRNPVQRNYFFIEYKHKKVLFAIWNNYSVSGINYTEHSFNCHQFNWQCFKPPTSSRKLNGKLLDFLT